MQDEEQQQPAPDQRAVAQRRVWLVGLGALGALVLLTVGVLAFGGDDDASSAGSTLPGVATDVDGSAGATTDAGAGTTDATVVGSTDPAASTATTGPDDPGTTVDGTTVAGSTTTTTATAPTLATLPPATVPFVPGNGDTVPVQTVVTAPPVSIDDVADPGTGMSFRLARLEAVQGEANGPGEIAGPAIRVTVEATNDTGAPVLLETVVVDLVYGSEKSSAAPLSGPGVVRFSGELAPGASATAVYVFDVPVDQRAEVSVVVSYAASVSPVVFTGPAPTK